MRRFLVLAVLALPAVPAFAAGFSSSGRGSTAAEFLDRGVGARAVAMGGAYSSVADDAGAMYWNPAALSRIWNRSATFMHASYVGSSYFDYSAYGQNLGNGAAFGAGLQYFSAGGIAQTDAAGADAGSFNPYDLALSLGGAYNLDSLGGLDAAGLTALKGFSVGAAAKLIRSRILTTAQTEALDFGVLSPAYMGERLRLAFTMTNLGGALKFDADKENLPLNFRLGGSYRISDRWLAALDVNFPRNDSPYAALGTEFQLAKSGPWKMTGRAGFNSETIGSIDGFSGVSVGIGLGYERLTVDYAFVPLGGLGQAHRMSLTCDF
ncbi:MAG: PorV/PorQ family protein [Elusimicrobiota bacterium]